MARQPNEPLTAREGAVLELLRRGLTNAQIASDLDITEHTVKDHVSAILRKLGVPNRHVAAYWPEDAPWWVRIPVLAPLAAFLRRTDAAPSALVPVVASAVLLGVVAGIGAFAFLLFRSDGVATTVIGRPTPTPTTQRTGIDALVDHAYPLFALNRDRLSVCVAGAGGSEPSENDLNAVREAFEVVLSDHPEAPDEHRDPLTSLGCPESQVPLGELESPGAFSDLVETPGEHYLFVYVVPEDLHAATFPPGQIVGGTEHVCSGDECILATLGLWLPDPIDDEILYDGLVDALSWGVNWEAQ